MSTFFVILSGLLLVNLSLLVFATNNFKRSGAKEITKLKKLMDNLGMIRDSLELQNTIEYQESKVVENKVLIEKLIKERDELLPIVEMQKDQINSILNEHSKYQKKQKLVEYFIGFLIGVTSSAIVSLIFYYINQPN